jgi:hypothetical protein
MYEIYFATNRFHFLMPNRMLTFGLDWTGSEQKPVAGSCENGNGPSVYIKFWEFFVMLNKYYVLKKDSSPCS